MQDFEFQFDLSDKELSNSNIVIREEIVIEKEIKKIWQIQKGVRGGSDTLLIDGIEADDGCFVCGQLHCQMHFRLRLRYQLLSLLLQGLDQIGDR